MAEQRVTDEQLTEWARDGISVGDFGLWGEVMVAEVRASRAREAEARAQATDYFERGLGFVREAELVAAERDEMRANWQAALAADAATAAERDALLQRIDKARQLTVRQFIGPARFKAEGYERTVHELAAALTGTEPDRA